MRDPNGSRSYGRGYRVWCIHGAWFSLIVLLAAAPFTASAVTLGQIDDFQDGTTDGWTTGHVTPANISNGGPAGAGDRYLQPTSSGGFGADSKLVIFNASQWLGNYSGAGITSVGMDLANFGAQALSMRLAFFLGPAVGYAATAPFSLPADSAWHHAFFVLNAANFTAVNSPSVSFDNMLTNFTGQLRILDSSSPSVQGDPIAATLGVDNVQAVPEPSSCVLVGVALLALLLRRRVPSHCT
jgi:PEP-CTERM motif